MRFNPSVTFVTLTLAVTFISVPSLAADCESVAGKLVSIQGLVEVSRHDSQQWHSASLDETLCQGDTIRIGAESRAAAALINDAILRLNQNTTLKLINITAEKKDRSWLELVKGAIQSFSRKPRNITVNTPYLNGTIEGTEFVLRVEENKEETQLTVFEGTVVAANDQGQMSVPGGNAVSATKGQAPQTRIVVKPRDEVQWALYYPPVLTGAQQTLVHAANLLDVGRVDEARVEIEKIIAADSGAGKAYALQTIILVVQNEPKLALEAGEKAAALDDTGAGSIALSYAQQANFNIAAARDGLLDTVSKHEDNALAWARLAELELMLGNKDKATTAASKAELLAPNLARAQLVFGFVELSSFHSDTAKAAFERAITLDSADPLAHLGLGLSKISDGDIASGRKEIEVAVSLDGSSALLRAYLGKAYFEEKRSPLDDQQFGIAKELDPNDPTAFLYSAISKQTANQPVDALNDVEQSMALNDNRAVYRGRLLLDKDRAARGASLARVYNDLGFTELGISEATSSLLTDPANAAAHRFLSDTYQGVRRHEIARVSELLQAQMLQDLNINPIQPSVSEANLNIVSMGGPSGAGFNEFTPLFQRNQTQLTLAALAGNNSTSSGEGAISGVYDRFSFSLSALTYDTDGWRENNSLEQDLYGLFVQAEVTDKLNVQAEHRHRESSEGDLTFNFNPADFSPDNSVQREQDTTRIGLRYSPSSHSHFLLSAIHSKYEERPYILDTSLIDFFLLVTDTTVTHDKGDQYEAQYIHQSEQFNLVAGAAHTKIDRIYNNNIIGTDITDPMNPIDMPFDQSTVSSKFEHPRSYVYVNVTASPAVTWTIGASQDNYKEDDLKVKSSNPKLGVQWNVTDDIRLRVAGFKVVKPALVNNLTLEPTQVAGFNQLFDDINGTKSEGYGVGLDWDSKNLKSGIELFKREMEEPALTFDIMFNPLWITEAREEQLHKIYLDWTPYSSLAVHTELAYDQYQSDPSVDVELPENAITRSLPIIVNYFDPSGYFVGLGVTGVDQSVRRSAFASKASGNDEFVMVDASVGYRFAQRRGVFSLAVKNLFDTEFQYQDNSYREFRTEPSTGPYFPVRMIMARCALSF